MSKTLVLLCLAVWIGEVQAQTEFGVKGGVNMSRMESGSTYSDYLFGVNAGIYFRGTDPFTVQIEMLYSGQGGSFRDPTTGEISDKRLHYLNPTFLFRYQPAKTFALVGGPLLGILITAREGSMNISDNYDPMDIGINAGIDYEMEKGFCISFRFLHSMRKIGNQTLQVSVGYRIQRLD